MNRRHPILYIARIVLEAKTPLSVSTGSPDGVFDTALVRDANRLPAIPGTSLAGVLRHLWEDEHDNGAANRLFGYQDRKEGQGSRLTVSWGALLDSLGRPAEGLLIGPEAKRLEDPLFQCALAQIDAPVHRNRVRLTHKGAAANTGKFDRAVLPAGNRFAVELRLQADEGDDGSEWKRLLGLLRHPGLRLGGATRAGLGRIACANIHQRRFDLRNSADIDAFRALGRGLADMDGLEAITPAADAAADGWLTGTLHLKARGLWRIGQGDAALDDTAEKPADLIPVTEERIDWSAGQGKRTLRAWLLPATSLKGSLAHRMAFHANRLSGRWAKEVKSGAEDEPVLPAAVTALLGKIKDKIREDEGGKEPAGRIGCLFIDDAFLPINSTQIARLMHNAIDRFTGGVRDRVLYEEESLLGGELEIPITLDRRRLEKTQDHGTARQALRLALADLCEGRLALGSRTSTGNGFFTGRLTGNLADWLHEDDAIQPAEAA